MEPARRLDSRQRKYAKRERCFNDWAHRLSGTSDRDHCHRGTGAGILAGEVLYLERLRKKEQELRVPKIGDMINCRRIGIAVLAFFKICWSSRPIDCLPQSETLGEWVRSAAAAPEGAAPRLRVAHGL